MESKFGIYDIHSSIIIKGTRKEVENWARKEFGNEIFETHILITGPFREEPNSKNEVSYLDIDIDLTKE